MDLAELAAAGRPLFETRPLMLTDAGRALGDRWPDASARDGDGATLRVSALRALAAAERDAIANEGERLLACLASDAGALRVDLTDRR